MKKSGVRVTYDGLKKLDAQLAAVAKAKVLIGIPSPENPRNEQGPIGNAALGYLNEKGSPVNNIPARPVLVPGVEKIKDRAAQLMGVGLQELFDEGEPAITRALNKAGIIAVSSVKNTLVAGEGFAPLKNATLAARRRKGFNGTKPLIVTAQLLGSYTYVIRKK